MLKVIVEILAKLLLNKKKNGARETVSLARWCVKQPIGGGQRGVDKPYGRANEAFDLGVYDAPGENEARRWMLSSAKKRRRY